MRSWKPIRVETLVSHRLLRVERHHLKAEGERREALVFGSVDWVNIVPRLDDGRVVLVRQWRYGIAATSLEIPGGLVDPGESSRTAALRELEEETGYRAGTIERLGELSPNPALFDNRISFWLATDLQQISAEPLGDGQEELEVVTVPFDDIPRLVSSGEIQHALNLCAFYLMNAGAAQ